MPQGHVHTCAPLVGACNERVPQTQHLLEAGTVAANEHVQAFEKPSGRLTVHRHKSASEQRRRKVNSPMQGIRSFPKLTSRWQTRLGIVLPHSKHAGTVQQPLRRTAHFARYRLKEQRRMLAPQLLNQIVRLEQHRILAHQLLKPIPGREQHRLPSPQLLMQIVRLEQHRILAPQLLMLALCRFTDEREPV
jgi:hypothetical protein